MSTLSEEVGLSIGQKLVFIKSSTAGFRGNVDIDEYDIVDESEQRVGGVRVTVHTDVKAPFRESRQVERIS